jgi:DNA polymerase-3 subunit alpha
MENNNIDLFSIDSIEELSEEDVYDISIEDKLNFFQNEHNYIANNIVVHNSHAAGVVVSDIPLEEIAPLRTAKGDMLATQYPNEDLESLGLIKFDVLAISTLSVIKRTVEMIKDVYDIDIPIENLPIDDEKTFELYRTGNLGGIFQCENYGMQKTMMEIGVDRFEDIVAALALYRPGPMDSIPEYCSRKRKESRVDYFDPVIEKYVKPYLESTYGIACYQEQIMQICNALAGFSITDGYAMIKAIGKKKEDLLRQYEQQFIDGCVSKGVKKQVATDYWKKFITPFASYGFNLAHSACYGLTSYITAYLKANYPDEFICSFLEVTINSSQGSRYDKVERFEREFQKKMKIKILRRDINKSKAAYTIESRKNSISRTEYSQIRPSLLCKGVGVAAAKNIEENQPFSDLKDFATRTDSSVVDTRVFDALLENGYFGPKAKEEKEDRQKQFVMFRSDLKKIAKKGIESSDLFG